jgi:hypothetical protein
MGRLCWTVLAGCLLLAACGGDGGETRSAPVDYRDFLQFGGVAYYVADHGVGRPVARGDLGPRFAVVRGNPPESDPTRAYRVRDRDAAFVPVGSPVFTVNGYRPTFRLAASHDGRLRLYEADAAVGARTGADLLDLAGKVRYLSVNSGRSELAPGQGPGPGRRAGPAGPGRARRAQWWPGGGPLLLRRLQPDRPDGGPAGLLPRDRRAAGGRVRPARVHRGGGGRPEGTWATLRHQGLAVRGPGGVDYAEQVALWVLEDDEVVGRLGVAGMAGRSDPQ